MRPMPQAEGPHPAEAEARWPKLPAGVEARRLKLQLMHQKEAEDRVAPTKCHESAALGRVQGRIRKTPPIGPALTSEESYDCSEQAELEESG